jgi:hypothetical protein
MPRRPGNRKRDPLLFAQILSRKMKLAVKQATDEAKEVYDQVIEKAAALVGRGSKRKYHRRKQAAVAAPKRSYVRRSRKKVGRPRSAAKK